MKKMDLAYIGNREVYRKRCEIFSADIQCSFGSCQSLDELFENSEMYSATQFFFITADESASEQEIAGMVQVLKQVSKKAFCTICVDSRISPEQLAFIRKSGANLILSEDEMLSSCKLEFAAAQIIHSSYFPIKSSELNPESTINLPLYCLLPLNKKFIPFFRAGDLISNEKLAKLTDFNELFVKREDLDLWSDYVESQLDNSKNSLARRLRVQYLQMSVSFFDILLLLSDKNETLSFETGKNLYNRCETISKSLLANLASINNPWEVIDQTVFFSQGPLERAPAVATYAGLAALKAGLPNPNEVMMAALLSDVGLLDVPNVVIDALKTGAIITLSASDLTTYQKHPIVSINQLLSRRLPLPEHLKKIIMTSHEMFNQKGFPKQPFPEKIPNESYLIQLCQMIDSELTVKIGQKRKDIHDAKKAVFDREIQSNQHIPASFLQDIRGVI